MLPPPFVHFLAAAYLFLTCPAGTVFEPPPPHAQLSFAYGLGLLEPSPLLPSERHADFFIGPPFGVSVTFGLTPPMGLVLGPIFQQIRSGQRAATTRAALSGGVTVSRPPQS